MAQEHYRLKYLPLFWEDLHKIALYIQEELSAPLAAQEFVEEVEQGILDHLENPTIATKYPSAYNREHPYYWFAVGNYMVFYVVIGDIMEVRRCLYASRNLKNLL